MRTANILCFSGKRSGQKRKKNTRSSKETKKINTKTQVKRNLWDDCCIHICINGHSRRNPKIQRKSSLFFVYRVQFFDVIRWNIYFFPFLCFDEYIYSPKFCIHLRLTNRFLFYIQWLCDMVPALSTKNVFVIRLVCL